MILFLRFDALSHSHDNDGGGGSSGGADDTFISTSLNFPMLIVLFLAIVARFSLIYTLVLCYRNYGLGLKEKMFQHAFRRNQLGHTGARHRPFDHENTGGSGGIADGFGGELGLSADQYNYAYMREDGKTNNHYNNPSGLRLHFYQTSSSLSSFSPPMAPMRTNTANSGENLNHHQARTTKRGKHHYYNPFRNTKQYGVDSDDRSNGISLQPLGKSSEIKKRENNSTTGDNNNENMPMCSNNGAGPVLFIKNELTANDDATGKTCYHHTRNIHTDEGGITGNSNNDNDIYSNRSSSVQGDIFSVGTFGAVYSESLIGRHDHNNCNATVNTNSIAIDVNEANANDRDNKNKSMDASASHRDSDTSTTPSYFFTPSLPRPSLNSFSYNSTSQNLRFSVYTNDVDHTDNAQTHTDSSTCDV